MSAPWRQRAGAVGADEARLVSRQRVQIHPNGGEPERRPGARAARIVASNGFKSTPREENPNGSRPKRPEQERRATVARSAMTRQGAAQEVRRERAAETAQRRCQSGAKREWLTNIRCNPLQRRRSAR